MLHHSPRTWLAWLPLVLACSQAGDAPVGDVVLTTSSSTSGTGDPPTTGTPTSSTTTTIGSSTAVGSTSTSDTSTSTSETSTSTDAASTTGDAPLIGCGNGELDPGEECDLGLVENSNSGACTIECKNAKCGDGLLQLGKEVCDNGASNNNTSYGGCKQNCQLGPRCNDGIVQDVEECDLGEDNGSDESAPDGVPCDDGCRYQARLVFLSSITYKGGKIGGVEGANAKCQLLAEKAGYDNSENFVAWLSDAVHSPAKDFLHTPGVPFVRADGVRIADDWDDLIKNGPHEGIFVTEKGETFLDVWVWTGTTPSGILLDPAAHCKAWTSLDLLDKGLVGRSGVDKAVLPKIWDQWHDNKQWTNLATSLCEHDYRIYCMEQYMGDGP
jgi:hypothetical protein